MKITHSKTKQKRIKRSKQQKQQQRQQQADLYNEAFNQGFLVGLRTAERRFIHHQQQPHSHMHELQQRNNVDSSESTSILPRM